AVLHVDVVQVVDDAAVVAGTHRGVRPDAAARDPEILLIRPRGRGHHRRQKYGACDEETGQRPAYRVEYHVACPPWLRLLLIQNLPSLLQCRNGHNRSRSLVSCHSRASPSGSTIRNTMMRTPKMTCSSAEATLASIALPKKVWKKTFRKT